MNKILKNITHLPRQIAAAVIDLYQLALSPDHSWLRGRFPYGYCRHYPTCSEYSKQAVLKFGVIKGGVYSAGRVLRCHPWAEPSVDPIPKA